MEIAVRAFGLAKRNLDVDAERHCHMKFSTTRSWCARWRIAIGGVCRRSIRGAVLGNGTGKKQDAVLKHGASFKPTSTPTWGLRSFC
jgi:hypothetical protein